MWWGGVTADGVSDVGERWGAALDKRWTVRIDCEEGEDSVGYRERAYAAAHLVSRLRGESDCTMSSPSLGPAEPCRMQPLSTRYASLHRNRVRSPLCRWLFLLVTWDLLEIY